MLRALSTNKYSSTRLIVMMLVLGSIAFTSIALRASNSIGGLGNIRFPEGNGLTKPLVQSANGQKIVFGSVRNGGNHDIFVMDLDGSNQIRLTNNPAYDDQPNCSPEGSRILFISDRDGNFEIYLMNADGSDQTRLTNNLAADGFPAWSPDEQRSPSSAAICATRAPLKSL